jgi:hypothetical protein
MRSDFALQMMAPHAIILMRRVAHDRRQDAR